MAAFERYQEHRDAALGLAFAKYGINKMHTHSDNSQTGKELRSPIGGGTPLSLVAFTGAVLATAFLISPEGQSLIWPRIPRDGRFSPERELQMTNALEALSYESRQEMIEKVSLMLKNYGSNQTHVWLDSLSKELLIVASHESKK